MCIRDRYGEIHYMFCDSAEQTLINHIRTRLRANLEPRTDPKESTPPGGEV